MFSRTLLFCQILSGLKRFPVDELGLGDYCSTYFLPQSRISERI